jgi:hypothetical protein
MGGHLSGGGQEGAGGHTAGGGMMAAGGNPGSGGRIGVGGDSGIMDALTDPVPNAEAGVENPQSGTRLKGKYIMGSDGSKEYLTRTLDVNQDIGSANSQGISSHPIWYDSMLMQDCSFYVAADGDTRCLVGRASPDLQGGSWGILYSDNQCTQLILEVINTAFGCPAIQVPTYGLFTVSPSPSTCADTTPTPVHVFQSGAKVATPATVYIIENNGNGGLSCQSLPTTGATFYQATEVPPSTFVQGTAGIDP